MDSPNRAEYRIEPEADTNRVVWGRLVLNEAGHLGIRAIMLACLAHVDAEARRSSAPRINAFVERMMELSGRTTSDLPPSDAPSVDDSR